MPPSWCCTVLRFMSTLMKPGAMTAPDSGASAIHTPMPSTSAPISSSPARIRRAGFSI